MDRPSFACICRLAAVFDQAGVRWAVGGATALVLHGVTRTTKDVDLFVDAADRQILQLLREHDIHPGMVSPQHAIAYVEGCAPGEKLDVCFPDFEPLISAIARATRVDVNGAKLPVLQLADIALAKLLSEAPKDARDVELLVKEGHVRHGEVATALSSLVERGVENSPYVRRHYNLELARKRLEELAQWTGT